jgi:hypothetical protein
MPACRHIVIKLKPCCVLGVPPHCHHACASYQSLNWRLSVDVLQANGVEYAPLTRGLSAQPAAASQGPTTTTPSTSSSSDPCACSTDGYSGGTFVGLTLTGCKQHGLDFGDSSFYCYPQAGGACSAASVSSAYPGMILHRLECLETPLHKKF